MALKVPPAASGKPLAPVGLVEKIREPLAFVLQQPEEQTDNWDDDFEDDPSFSKLQGICPSPITQYLSAQLCTLSIGKISHGR